MTTVAMPGARFGTFSAASIGFAVLLAVALLIRPRPKPPALIVSPPLVSFAAAPLSQSDVRDKDIAFYTQRLTDDPNSAIDQLALANLVYARARSTGSTSDLQHAESLARQSIARRTRRNGQAYEVLASALMARHAFRDAHAIAVTADSLEPDTPSHLALLGEIELELGAYESAANHFRAVHYDGRSFTIGARVARWYEVTGHADIAREMLRRAIAAADQRTDLPHEQAAWYHYRLGELELRLGATQAADSAFQRGLKKNPDDVRILAGLARSALARHEWRKAADVGELAISIQLEPTTLGTISEAYAALGDTAQASRYADAMSRSALTQPGPIHRAWGQFLLDHGTARDQADVLRRARLDLRERQDVYGHDLMAWALFRAGRIVDAKAEMRLALSQQTEDVMLTAHAQAIGAIGASGVK
jgi:tetratricopeptide (TPR) repeat protein